jgi:hypothetical protein
VRRTETNDLFEDSAKVTIPLADEAAVVARVAELERILNTDTSELIAAQMAWEAEVGSPIAWSVLKTASPVSAGNATFETAGGWIAAGGWADCGSRYVHDDVRGEFEADHGDAAGGAADGRFAAAGSGAYAARELRAVGVSGGVTASESAQPRAVIGWSAAVADHEQRDYPVAHAVDGNGETGWAVGNQYGVRHVAVFVPNQPFELAAGASLRITLEQNYGGQHTIGRLRLAATADQNDPRREMLPQAVRSALDVPRERRSEAQLEDLRKYFRDTTPLLVSQREELASLRRRLDQRPTSLVMRELAEPRETFVHIRGNFLNHGERVEAGVPTCLPPLHASEKSDRLALARWLIDDENPLTARVTINRIWEQYFGRGLVLTSEDFGIQGEPPSHPELLDWLATELVGEAVPGDSATVAGVRWRLKRMHRLIVTSSTYRQSSNVTPALLEKDPHNRSLARGPRFRLEAELLRDQAIAVSALLSEKMGGPSVMPSQPDGVWNGSRNSYTWTTSAGDDRFRRGIYTFWRRATPYPSFVSFDAPNREVVCTRRPRTNTPLQALTTLNDPEFVAPAAALARRMMVEGGTRAADRVSFGFRAVLIRPPLAEERDRLVALYEQQLRNFRGDTDAAAKLVSNQTTSLDGADNPEVAAWTVVANVLLNLDEVLTKG